MALKSKDVNMNEGDLLEDQHNRSGMFLVS